MDIRNGHLRVKYRQAESKKGAGTTQQAAGKQRKYHLLRHWGNGDHNESEVRNDRRGEGKVRERRKERYR